MPTVAGDFVKEILSYDKLTNQITWTVPYEDVPAVGNTVILSVRGTGGGAVSANGVDSQGNVYLLDAVSSNATGARASQLSATIVNPVTTADTITLTMDRLTQGGVIAGEYSGVMKALYRQVVNAQGNSQTVAATGSTAAVAALARTLVVSSFSHGSDTTNQNMTNALGEIHNQTTRIHQGWIRMLDLATNGVVQWTWTTNSTWAIVAVDYRSEPPVYGNMLALA